MDSYNDEANPSTELTAAAFTVSVTSPLAGIGYLLVFLYYQKQGRYFFYNILFRCNFEKIDQQDQRLMSAVDDTNNFVSVFHVARSNRDEGTIDAYEDLNDDDLICEIQRSTLC